MWSRSRPGGRPRGGNFGLVLSAGIWSAARTHARILTPEKAISSSFPATSTALERGRKSGRNVVSLEVQEEGGAGGKKHGLSSHVAGGEGDASAGAGSPPVGGSQAQAAVAQPLASSTNEDVDLLQQLDTPLTDTSSAFDGDEAAFVELPASEGGRGSAGPLKEDQQQRTSRILQVQLTREGTNHGNKLPNEIELLEQNHRQQTAADVGGSPDVDQSNFVVSAATPAAQRSEVALPPSSVEDQRTASGADSTDPMEGDSSSGSKKSSGDEPADSLVPFANNYEQVKAQADEGTGDEGDDVSLMSSKTKGGSFLSETDDDDETDEMARVKARLHEQEKEVARLRTALHTKELDKSKEQLESTSVLTGEETDPSTALTSKKKTETTARSTSDKVVKKKASAAASSSAVLNEKVIARVSADASPPDPPAAAYPNGNSTICAKQDFQDMGCWTAASGADHAFPDNEITLQSMNLAANESFVTACAEYCSLDATLGDKKVVDGLYPYEFIGIQGGGSAGDTELKCYCGDDVTSATGIYRFGEMGNCDVCADREQDKTLGLKCGSSDAVSIFRITPPFEVNQTSGKKFRSLPVKLLKKYETQVFEDRPFLMESWPSQLDPLCRYLQLPNDDAATPSYAIQTSLDFTNMDMTVYVDLWDSIQHPNTGHFGWTKWPEKVRWNKRAAIPMGLKFNDSGVTFQGPVYQRNYFRGTTALLYGNDGSGHGTYAVFVCPKKPYADNPFGNAVMIQYMEHTVKNRFQDCGKATANVEGIKFLERFENETEMGILTRCGQHCGLTSQVGCGGFVYVFNSSATETEPVGKCLFSNSTEISEQACNPSDTRRSFQRLNAVISIDNFGSVPRPDVP
ncbi:unnamed protein product [Amoebophrya sp. A120]|nr:unnamed protein product [Amoebophrya sp. A120]|eukprot:GSA120T00006630001.1